MKKYAFLFNIKKWNKDKIKNFDSEVHIHTISIWAKWKEPTKWYLDLKIQYTYAIT